MDDKNDAPKGKELDERVQDVLKQIDECTEEESNLVRTRLGNNVPEPFVLAEVAGRRHLQNELHTLLSALRGAGLLARISNQQIREAIARVQGGVAVDSVVNDLTALTKKADETHSSTTVSTNKMKKG